MKRFLSLTVLFLLFAAQTQTQPISGLLGFDEAIEAAVAAIEAKLAEGTEIAVYKINAPSDEIGDFLGGDLNDRFAVNGKLVPLAREDAMRYVVSYVH